MDSSRFDALTRAFVRPASRRQTLAGVVAAALAPVVAAAQPEPAKCLAQGKRCQLAADQDARHGKGKHGGKGGKGKHHPPSCAKCCSRYGAAGPDGKARCACKPEGADCTTPSQCCGGLCRDGKCTRCPDDLTACNGNCVDLQTDHDHCGDCANACASGQRCVAGDCVCDATSCPRGCCDANAACQRGTDDRACGVGGAACKQCGTCTSCDGTTCAAQSGVCCGDASVCQSGTCQPCADGQRCHRGACVCDATSCAGGCCDGDVCVPYAQQTKQRCGTGGAACRACTGNDTCGGGDPGKPGVCGCTPNCDGQHCGGDNDCGGTCGCPECQACHAGGICEQVDDGTPCGGDGSGLRCCGGTCPPPQTCLPAETCCGQDTTCKTCCGTIETGYAACSETGGYACANSEPGQPCVDDSGCGDEYGSAICRCGTCCVASGGDGDCPDPSLCCSGTCNGLVCA